MTALLHIHPCIRCHDAPAPTFRAQSGTVITKALCPTCEETVSVLLLTSKVQTPPAPPALESK